MAKKKVVLDIGHLSSDSGAVGNGFKEVDLNNAIAKYSVEALRRSNIEVLVTKGTLAERCAAEKKFGADCTVSVHNNAGGGDGVEALYTSEEGKKLAEAILKAIVNAGLNNSRGLKKRDGLYILKNTASPATIVECAFVDTKDVQAVDEEHERKAFGVQIAKGTCAYLGVPYVDEAKPTPPPTQPVDTEQTVQITADVLNVRSGPSSDYGINRQIYKGEIYTIVKVSGTWGKLKSGVGWISMKYTKPVASKPTFNSYKVQVTADSLNVRRGPGTSYAVSTTVKKGQVYTIVDKSGTWGKLKSGAGWISLNYTKNV